MVSNASEDLPEPEGPVTTVNVRRGISRSNPFRLCCRAPRTMMLSFTLPNLSGCDTSGPTDARTWPANAKTPPGNRPAALEPSYYAAEEEEYYRAERRKGYRPEVEATSRYRSPTDTRPDETANERANDSENDRDNASRRIPPWHQKLRQRSRHQTQKDPVEPERH